MSTSSRIQVWKIDAAFVSTGQLFFDDEFMATIEWLSPYNENVAVSLNNDEDSIFEAENVRELYPSILCQSSNTCFGPQGITR